MPRANWTADTQARQLDLYALDGTAETLVACIEDRYAAAPGGTKDQARATSCTIGVNCGGTDNCGSLTGIYRARQTLSAGLCEECGNPTGCKLSAAPDSTSHRPLQMVPGWARSRPEAAA